MSACDSKKITCAMCSIMRETESIAKSRTNKTQGFAFRGIDDVYNTLHGIFAKNGVFILPEVLEHRIEARTTAKGGTAYDHISKIKFRFCCDDGSEVSAITIGEAADSGDKGASKAASIALKYALFQIFLIPTQDESDDADAQSWQFAKPAPKVFFTAQQAAEAKKWAESMHTRAYENALKVLGVDDLTRLEYARKRDFTKIVSDSIAQLKSEDNPDGEAKNGDA